MSGKVIEFEFGETVAAKAFWDRNPKAPTALTRLFDLANMCFSRSFHANDRAEDIVFNLGQTCRDDFLEIVFLAVNGYGAASQKLLRGLFERAVAIEYIRINQEKAERFVRYAAIQEFKAAKKALDVVTQEEFDRVVAAKGTSFSRMKQLHDEVKPEFQITACDKCGTKTTAFSWDIDVASMVNKIGEPYSTVYVGAYTLPTLSIHATLASAFSRHDADDKDDQNVHEAEFALIVASMLFIAVARSQNEAFSLDLGREIDTCWNDVTDVWKDRPHGPVARTNAVPKAD